MIVTKDKRDVDKLASNQEQAFSIKASAKSFKILSDGLYKNKILAIIRELSCNAFDAHIAAKKEKVPFIIHFPTSLEPWFAVRDEGIGLSRSDVMTLYTTYFESTKSESNDFVGALGLGSKSPFSYVDNFTVVSRYKGEEMMFSCFINDSGLPSIVELGSKKTTEGNGMEVKLPVRREDMSTFSNEGAKFFTTWLSVEPKMSGAPVEPLTLKKEEEGTGWFRATRVNENGTSAYWVLQQSNSSNAIQGNVCYPIDKNIIRQKATDQILTAWQNFFLNEPNLYLECSIGDLDIAPSREELDYSPHTIKNLLAKIDTCEAEYMAILDTQFGEFTKAKSRVEFRLAVLNKLNSMNNTSLRAVCEQRYAKMKYDGVEYTLEGIIETGVPTAHHTRVDQFSHIVQGHAQLQVNQVGLDSWQKSRDGLPKLRWYDSFTMLQIREFEKSTKKQNSVRNHTFFVEGAEGQKGFDDSLAKIKSTLPKTNKIEITTRYCIPLSEYTRGNDTKLFKPIVLVNDIKRVKSLKRKIIGYLNSTRAGRHNSNVMYVPRPEKADAAWDAELKAFVEYAQPCELVYMSTLPKYPEEDTSGNERVTEKLQELFGDGFEVTNPISGFIASLPVDIADDKTFNFRRKDPKQIRKQTSDIDISEDKAVYVFACRDEYFMRMEIPPGKDVESFTKPIGTNDLAFIRSVLLEKNEKLIILKRHHLGKIKKNENLMSVEQALERYLKNIEDKNNSIKKHFALLAACDDLDWNTTHLRYLVATSERIKQIFRTTKIKRTADSPFFDAWSHIASVRDELTIPEYTKTVTAMAVNALHVGGHRRYSEVATNIFGAAVMESYFKEAKEQIRIKDFSRYSLFSVITFAKSYDRSLLTEDQIIQIVKYVSLIDNSISA
jgi:hypothetical protein